MKLLSTTLAASNRHGFRATPALRNLLPALVTELQSTHELREAHASPLLRGVLVELKRIVKGEAVDREKHTRSEQRTQAFITELPSTCDQHWTLAKMASHCGIQRTQLGKVFQKLTGSSPMEYLFRLRMERAKTLLRETDIKIIDIAFECGYGSSQYFANAFKQSTGTSPSGYRLHCKRPTATDLEKWAAIGFRSEREERRRIQDFSGD
jgi:transcriptional regulator GlxA family with amidase domain